ncbi:DUF826 domain-containing protein [Escherichia coli]|nr:DUF826 domain-containing protein [Escherichia coli]QWV70739.1 DUF826 domain-containing protein [Escherichia coli O158:H23]EHU4695426.1 DUF826 domain-containing protein [Escherichia coli]EHW6702867.1 DUF826 domain-containing protein [Escherichia coli]EHY1946733.1 DUF826 domain-containing protein [Escherichia coli]
MPQQQKKSVPVRLAEQSRKGRSFRNRLLYNTSQRENPMTELNKLVTADAVKAALRSEEVRGKLKETIRKTFEAQIDADVEAILDELIGPAEVQPGAPTGEDAQADDPSAENGAAQPETASGGEAQPEGTPEPEPATLL